MLHSSLSWLLLAAPFACCVWAAAAAGPGRRREENSGPGDGGRPQTGNLNERLASLDSKLALLAESNKQLAANLRSVTAQLCLAQAEIGNRKDELTCALARQNQLEAQNLERQQELERGSLRLRAVEAELANRTRVAESAGERKADGERALQVRVQELEERLLAGQRELGEKSGQLALAEQRCQELASRARAAESAGERQADGERALQARILELEERLLAGQLELGEKSGQLALAEQRWQEIAGRTRAVESAGERLAEGERARQARILELEERLLAGQRELVQKNGQFALAEQRCEELEAQAGRHAEELRLQVEARRAAESRASEQERAHSARQGELEGHLAQRDEELRQRSAALKDLRSELSESARRETERSRRCAELDEELRLQVEEQRALETRARELDQELSARIADLEARAGRREEELRERTAALEALRGELAAEAQRGAERARRCVELETGLGERLDERQTLAGRIAELEAQLLFRERELRERSAAAEDMRGQLDYGRGEGDALSVRCAELERLLGVREQELQVLRDELTALSGRCEELSRTLEGRLREHNEHELQLAQAGARIGELELEGQQRAAQHAAELATIDELAEGRIAAVLHGHAGQAPAELPPGYVEGVEQHDLARALGSLLGGSAPLSSDALLRLGEHWREQHAAWNSEPIEGEVVYLWADAPFVRVGLEPEGAALLVIVAGMVDGSRRVVSVEAGPRESAPAWLAALERLARRGMNVPRLVIAEDALGLWPALAQLGWDCAQQRCWDRRIEHVVASLPRRQQRKAGELLRTLAKSETRAEANERKAAFVKRYKARRPDAVARIQADWEQLLSLYSFPADHWPHLRTTAVVESLLTSLRLQTSLSKPHPPAPNAEALLWKLLLIGARGLRKLNSPQLLPAVAAAEPCSDGILGGRARGRAA
jgi:hypothetical protein